MSTETLAKPKPKFDAIAYLERLHTRQLMQLLQACRRCDGRYDVLDNHSPCVVTIEQVKRVLAAREHIPNKSEAKVIRQKRASNRY